MNAINSKHIGVLSVFAVAMLVAVCFSPMLFDDESDAATGDGTIYLRPGDTYTWTPTFNIDSGRVSLAVNASISTTAGTFSSTSTAGGVTASVSNKVVSISVDDGTAASTVYVKVKAITTEVGFTTDMKAYKANPGAWPGTVADVSGFLRLALTGKENSPDLYTVMQLLGKERTESRIRSALAQLG